MNKDVGINLKGKSSNFTHVALVPLKKKKKNSKVKAKWPCP